MGSDRSQLASTAKAAKEAIGTETLDAIADRGYFNGDEIKTCDDAGITVTLPKPMTSRAKANGRFGKEDFVYLAAENVYRCPAGEKLTYRFTSEEHGLKLHRYWTNACRTCSLKSRCTPDPQRRITRWEHEDVLEAVQKRLDENPQAMRTRRETAEHPLYVQQRLACSVGIQAYRGNSQKPRSVCLTANAFRWVEVPLSPRPRADIRRWG